ncbi:MAG: hypothetical protein GF381_00645 [Candidatus Pacebacteria bacterium]|nr:hypothetical protein [Candidatus Paceibacterota bacterium]
MIKKISAVLLGSAMFLTAYSRVSAQDQCSCPEPSNMMCECPSTVRNSARVRQRVEAYAFTGNNVLQNSTSGSYLYRTHLRAGSQESQYLDTGHARVNIEDSLTLNTTRYPQQAVTNNRETYLMPFRVQNNADINQELMGTADTGMNALSNSVTVNRAACSSARAGGDQTAFTGNATVSIGTVSRVNYNYR